MIGRIGGTICSVSRLTAVRAKHYMVVHGAEKVVHRLRETGFARAR
jgi:hypothetical protein